MTGLAGMVLPNNTGNAADLHHRQALRSPSAEPAPSPSVGRGPICQGRVGGDLGVEMMVTEVPTRPEKGTQNGHGGALSGPRFQSAGRARVGDLRNQ